MNRVEEMVQAAADKMQAVPEATTETTEGILDNSSLGTQTLPSSDVEQAAEPVEKTVNWEKRYNDNNLWAQEQKRIADSERTERERLNQQLVQLQSLNAALIQKMSPPANEPAPVEDWDSLSEGDRNKLLRQMESVAERKIFALGFDPEAQKSSKVLNEWNAFMDGLQPAEKQEFLESFQPIVQIMLEELPEVRRDRDGLSRLRKICNRFKEEAARRTASGTQTGAASVNKNGSVKPVQTLNQQRQDEIKTNAGKLATASKQGAPVSETPRRTVRSVHDMVEAAAEKLRARNA